MFVTPTHKGYTLQFSLQELLSRSWNPTDKNTSYCERVLGDRRMSNWCDAPVELVQEIVLKGWKKGYTLFSKLSQELDHIELPFLKRKKVKSDTGHTLDIQQVYSGSLDKAWESTKKIREHKGVRRTNITIICNIGFNASMTTDRAMWAGIAVASISDALIRSGRNVRVICGLSSREATTRDKTVNVIYTAKEYNEQFDINSLIVSMAYLPFARMYVYPAMFTCPEKISEGMGSAGSIRIEDLPDELTNDTNIVFPNDIFSENAATQWLKNVVEDFNKGRM